MTDDTCPCGSASCLGPGDMCIPVEPLRFRGGKVVRNECDDRPTPCPECDGLAPVEAYLVNDGGEVAGYICDGGHWSVRVPPTVTV